jgi:hypothetical protein
MQLLHQKIGFVSHFGDQLFALGKNQLDLRFFQIGKDLETISARGRVICWTFLRVARAWS